MKATNIKPVQMYRCPLTGDLFKTVKGALKSAEKEQKRLDALAIAEKEAAVSNEEREKKMDYIRLNLNDVNDLPSMLITHANEVLNVEITDLKIDVSFGNVSNSHGAPLNGVQNWSNQYKDRPTSYLGWSGQISAMVKYKGEIGKNWSTSATDFLFGKMRGFHSGGGCPGDAEGKYKMDIGFYFFLDDFPLLLAKHQLFLEEKEKFIQNKLDIQNMVAQANNHSESLPELDDIKAEIGKLTTKMYELKQAAYNKYLSDHPLTPQPISPEFDWMKTQFVGRWNNDWLYN